MFSCRSFAWIMCFWSLLFSYTFLTYKKFSNKITVIPLITLCFAVICCSALLIHANVVHHTKTIIWFSSWVVVICIGIILYTLDIIDDVFINIYITIFSAVASLFWCVASHAEKITEQGLHWYIWSVTTIIAITSAYQSSSDTAIIVYIVNCIIISLINIIYLFYICKVQPSGNRRCRHWWRIAMCFTLSLILLIGSLLNKTKIITTQTWGEYILVFEALLLIIVATDSLIGFHQDRIYAQVSQQDNDVL